MNTFFIKLAEIVSRKKYVYAAFSVVFIFAIIKIPFLFLPYYWDEAWPYSAAIHHLTDNGLSFMPGAIPPDISRGHPLLFHFLGALWMKIFGSGFVSGHSYSLFISILLLISIFYFGRSFFSERVGFVSLLIFCSLSVFAAQSIFLLPEVLIALWTLLSFHSFFKNKKILYMVFATLLLLTKESGIVLICTFITWKIIQALRSGNLFDSSVLKENLYLVLPAVFASVFFILQKVQQGWFFFPHHLDMVSVDRDMLTQKLPNAVAYLFIYFGRNGFSFFIIVSLLVILLKRISLSRNERVILPVIFFFILIFLFFSASFFFIPRYLLCLFPPFIIAGTVLLDKALSKYRIFYLLTVTGLIITNVFYCFHNPDKGEFKYMRYVQVHQMVVEWCEGENLQGKNIYANFTMGTNLKEVHAGYLSGKAFQNIQDQFTDSTEIFIFSNDDFNKPLLEQLLNENRLRLLKHFERSYARCDIYEVVK